MREDHVRYIYGKKHPYLSLFHETSGVYVRTGLREDGSGTDQDPFMGDFPELLDIGIMGHDRQGQCQIAGTDCCLNVTDVCQEHMLLEDFQKIIRACEGKTYQVMLTGRGDPEQHPDFEEMVKCSRRHGIVPNITTSGVWMTAELAAVCARYCGTVAVHSTYGGTAAFGGMGGTISSCEMNGPAVSCGMGGTAAPGGCREGDAHKAVDLLLKAGVRTDFYYVLRAATIGKAVQLLETNGFPAGIHAVVFLLDMPSGTDRKEKILITDMPLWKEFFRLVDKGGYPFQIGFESCMVPGVLCHTHNIEPESLDACEGGRWSAYITPDLYLLPCGLVGGDKRYAVSLKDHTIEEAWNSKAFDRFRGMLQNACPDCGKRENCMGGCPLFPEMILCDQKARKNRCR